MSLESLELLEKTNTTFYSNCRAYFEALQEQGKTDYAFEDEFYYTMPGISGRD